MTVEWHDAEPPRVNEEPPADLEARRKADFEFMVVAHSKGDPAMYELFRDRELDKWRGK
jgi:hypothetical protein